jgi:hypothetical protein
MALSSDFPDRRPDIQDCRIRYLSAGQSSHHHRSGWEYALANLDRLVHPEGVLFDTWVDNTYAWDLTRFSSQLPLREPWVGVVHNPPNIPENLFPAARPQRYSAKDLFQRSLEHCRGLFALSAYQANWFTRLNVPVDVVLHPVDLDVPPFRWDLYRAAHPRRALHVGWWLRRLQSFGDLVAPDHRKILLKLPDPNAERAIQSVDWHDVELVPYQSNLMYDRLLQQSVVFSDLIDASANNGVLDCIARATPLVINRHPAVEEYLGPGYPLFYDSLGEASEILAADDLLLAGHRYLANPEFRQRFSGNRFVETVRASAVYRSLPVC